MGDGNDDDSPCGTTAGARTETAGEGAPVAAGSADGHDLVPLGYLRVMFAVDDIGDTLERLHTRGAQLVGAVVQYKDAYRLCYIRGPEGLLIGLAQELS
jgi:predicted enzyme related to lactoylglutathione lyase